VDTGEVGHIQPHEHVLSAIGNTARRQGSALASDEPIRLDNYYEIRRHHSAFDAIVDDVEDAVAELTAYRREGGSAIVDATSIGLGRDPRGLVEVATRTDLHIVMGSGYYHHDYHPPELAEQSRHEIATRIHRDVVDGVDETGIRSGVIGEIGLGWPVHPDEDRVLRAAVDAQASTGAALMIHPGRHADAPLDAMRRVTEEGVDSSRLIMSHIDRTLFDLDAMLRLADTGCYLEFDLFGQESSYYPFAEIDMPNDATRVDYLVALRDRGYGDRLLVAQDICFKSHLQRYGGEGYGHLLRNVVPLMRRKGLDDEAITQLTVHNPLTVLGIAA
jgi:phosphotriesterase-related protein